MLHLKILFIISSIFFISGSCTALLHDQHTLSMLYNYPRHIAELQDENRKLKYLHTQKRLVWFNVLGGDNYVSTWSTSLLLALLVGSLLFLVGSADFYLRNHATLTTYGNVSWAIGAVFFFAGSAFKLMSLYFT